MSRPRSLLTALLLLVTAVAACGAPRGNDGAPTTDAATVAPIDGASLDAPDDAAGAADAPTPPDAPEVARPDAADARAEMPAPPECNGDCGPHGHAHGSECHCDEGYVDRDMCCVPAPSCTAPDDSLEDNDGPSSATPVRDGSATFDGLRVCPADADVFRVPLTMGQQVEVRATFTHAAGDIDVYLFAPGTSDLGHTRPLAGSDRTVDNERFTYTAARTGDHLLLVTGYNGSENTYDLSVRVTGP